MLVYGQSLFPDQAALASGLTMGVGNTLGAFGAWGIGTVAAAFGLPVGILAAAGCLVAAALPSRRLSPRGRFDPVSGAAASASH